MEIDQITERVIAGAIEVHRRLGPGLLESAYETCLASELLRRGLSVERQRPVAVIYRDEYMDAGYRLDLFVNSQVIVEVKAVAKLDRIHVAQVITYLKLSGARVGLLINFNVERLTDGLRRVLLNFEETTRRPRRPRR